MWCDPGRILHSSIVQTGHHLHSIFMSIFGFLVIQFHGKERAAGRRWEWILHSSTTHLHPILYLSVRSRLRKTSQFFLYLHCLTMHTGCPFYKSKLTLDSCEGWEWLLMWPRMDSSFINCSTHLHSVLMLLVLISCAHIQLICYEIGNLTNQNCQYFRRPMKHNNF